jgi:YesN/AraC family two-component response regulator
MIVREVFLKLGLSPSIVELGEVQLAEDVSEAQRMQIRSALLPYGLELMQDRNSILIEKIKNVIVDLVHYSEEPLTVNLSEYLHQQLQLDYTYLSNLFSEVQGTTIEKFYISHKIERVKELLVYNELSLTEIAHCMHYSSVAHLSNQFKKVTDLTPSHFKQLSYKRRRMLEDL